MGKGIKSNIDEFTSTAQDYIESSIAYYQLDLFKKIMKGLIDGVHKIIIGFFLLIALLFLSVALSIYLGTVVGSLAAGYLIVGAFYMIVMIIAAITLKPYLTKVILTRSSQSFFNKPIESTPNEPEDLHQL